MFLCSWYQRLYLLERASAESESKKHVVIGHERVSDADDHERPLREEEHRLTTQVIRQRREQYRAEYHTNHENRLRQVFEILTIADEVPL